MALDHLADAVELLGAELADGKEPMASRGLLQNVAQSASRELIGDGGFSARVVLVQLRSIAVAMLEARGMPRNDALAELPALARRPEGT